MICGSGGSKSRLAKAAGAEPSGQMRNEKLHTVVARSTSRSQNVQNSSGPLLEVEMSKKCTLLWREAHVQVKKQKTHHIRSLLEVEMWKKCTPLWREAHFEVKMLKNTRGSVHFWRFRCRFAWQTQGIVHLLSCSIFNYNHHYTTLHSNTLHLQYMPLHCITLHYTPLHYTTLNYIQLHYTTLHYTTLHYIPLHYTTLHSTTLHYIILHYTPLHYTTLNDTALHLQLQLQLQLHYIT